MLLDLMEDRHGEESAIITSQLLVNQWHEFISEPMVAEAILVLMVYGSHRIEFKGELS